MIKVGFIGVGQMGSLLAGFLLNDGYPVSVYDIDPRCVDLLVRAVAFLITPSQVEMTLDRSLGAMAVAGLLVGFGTTLGNGCTSGHGVCGISRLSKRSIVATATFMAVGAIIVFVVNHVLGGTV